jgi:PAS domain S-box-containing protein
VSYSVFSVLFDDSNDPILILDEKGSFFYTNKKFNDTFLFLSNEDKFKNAFKKAEIEIASWLNSEQANIEFNVNHTLFKFEKKSIKIENNIFYKIYLSIPDLKNEKNKSLASIVGLLSKLMPENEFFYIFSYFPEPKYRYVSPNVKQIIGYTIEDFYEDAFILNRNNIHDDSFFKVYERNMLDRNKEISQKNVITYSIKDKKGNLRWLQDTSILIDKEKRVVFGFVRDITEIKLSQQTYLNLLENIPVPYIVIDKEGIIIHANSFFYDFMKIYDKVKFLENKHSYKEFLIEKYHEIAENRVKSIFEEKKTNDFIFYEIKNFNNEIYKVRVRSIPINYNNQNCMLTTILDLTLIEKYNEEKIRLEYLEKYKRELENNLLIISNLNRELEIQKNRFDILMNQSDFLIWILDENFRFTYFNKNFVDKFFLNYKSTPELNKTGDECILDSELKSIYRNFWYKNYDKVLKGEKIELEKVDEVMHSEYPVIRIINLFPLYDNNGKIIEIAGIARDISEKILSKKLLAKQMAEMKSILENGPHYYWTINKRYEITNFNKNYEKLFFLIYNKYPAPYIKVNRNEKHLSTGIDEILKNYEIAFKGNQVAFDVKLKHYSGFEQYLSVYMMPIFSENNEVEEISIMALDITDKVAVLNDLKENEQKLSVILKEKEILLKELHHRVKNNLQVISSILNIQSRYISDIGTKSVIDDTKNRINSMYLIHENLYRSKDLDYLNVKVYLQDIFNNVVNSFIERNNDIRLHFQSDDILLSNEVASPLGLILNELITNSFKHGIPKSLGKKFISVSLVSENKYLTLSVTDSGPGLRDNPFLNPEKIKTLGMILIRDLTYQLDGEINLNNVPGSFNISIKFKSF